MWRVKNWKKYIVVVVVIYIQCEVFRNGAEAYYRIMNQVCKISLGDYIVDFYKGTIPYTRTSQTMPFNIPGLWSLYFMYFFAIVGQSVNKMFQSNGYQSAMRHLTRKRWFMHQNYIIWKETFLYLAVTYVTFFLYSLFHGSDMAGADIELQENLNGIDLSVFGGLELVINTVVVPFVVMLGMAYVQYAASLSVNVITGILVSVVILVGSVFHASPLLIGNYLMLMRDEKMLAGGNHAVIGILICIAVIVLSFLAGNKMMGKKDIF